VLGLTLEPVDDLIGQRRPGVGRQPVPEGPTTASRQVRDDERSADHEQHGGDHDEDYGQEVGQGEPMFFAKQTPPC